MNPARACPRRSGAVSMPAVGLLALGAALLATGVIVGSLVIRQSSADREQIDAADSGLIAATAQAPAQSQPAQSPAVSPGQPPILFDPPVMELGIISPGQAFSRDVQVINTSAAPVKILYSRATCTCTSVNLADTVIPPGESVPLKIRYDGQMTLGQKTSLVRVAVEGYEGVASIAIKAEVSLTIHALPSYIRASEVRTGVVSLEALDGRPFNLLTVNGGPPDIIEDSGVVVEGPRANYRIRWDFSGYNDDTCRDPDGRRVPEWLAVETDHPDCPIFDIYVRHPCTVPLPPSGGRQWVPSERHALVGALRPGETAEYTIGLKWLGRIEPNDTVHTVSSDNEDFVAELVESRQTADLIELRIRVTPKEGHRGLFYGQVWLHAARNSAPMTVIGTVREDLVPGDASG